MKLRHFLKSRAVLLGIAVCASIGSPAAFADLKAYNAAVKAGDCKTAAKWSLKAAADAANCRLNSNNHVFKAALLIG